MSVTAPPRPQAPARRSPRRARPGVTRPALAGPSAAPDLDVASGGSDDSSRVMVLLAMFTIAPLVMVGALWGAAAIGTWWALVILMALHLTTTALIFEGVVFVMSGHGLVLRRHAHVAG